MGTSPRRARRSVEDDATDIAASGADPSSPPWVFVGAGALGQIFATALAAGGQAVTLLATPESAARLLGARAIRLHGAFTLAMPVALPPACPGQVAVTDDPGDLPAGARLVFTTKGHQLPAAIATVRAVWPAAGDLAAWVAGVQNGLVKDDLLSAAFGVERVVGAVTILAGQREPDGRVAVTSRGATYLGELEGGISPRAAAAVADLNRVGIPAEATADIQSVLWSKACNAVGVFGVSALTRGGAPFSHPDLARAYLSLIRETAATAAACGVAIGDYTNFPIRRYLETPEDELIAGIPVPPAAPAPSSSSPALPSMTQDLLAGRPLEVDEIFGHLVARAERAGVPVPRATLARDLIRGMDPGHRRSS